MYLLISIEKSLLRRQRDLGLNLVIIGNFGILSSSFSNCIFVCYQANFHCCKGPNIQQIIQPSDHTYYEAEFTMIHQFEPSKSCQIGCSDCKDFLLKFDKKKFQCMCEICQILRKPQKILKSCLNFYQTGQISPNLVKLLFWRFLLTAMLQPVE